MNNKKEYNQFFDKSYKILFDNKIFIKSLIKFALPEKIFLKLKWRTLKSENVNFVSPELGIREADRLYSIKMSNKQELYVYFLIEFKSTPDKITPLMLYIYIALIYHNLIKIGKIKRNKPKVPAIIPIVLYIGDKKWNKNISIKELMEKEMYKSFQEYIPEIKYILIDKNRYSDHELEEMKDIISGLLYLEKMKEGEVIKRVRRWGEIFFRGVSKEDKRALISYMKALVSYKFEIESNEVKLKRKEEEADMFATAIEKELKRQKQRGIQQGMQKGIHKGKLDTAKKMLENGAKIAFIEAVTGLTTKEIESLKK